MSTYTGRSVFAVWLVLVVCGSLLALVAHEAGPLPGDLALAWVLQGLPPPRGVAGALLSNTDSAVWLLLVAVLAIMLLRRWWSTALYIFLTSLTGLVVSIALKLIVARPRPSAELVRVYDPSETYGFPSTTAFFSVVLAGIIVYLIWRAEPPRPVLIFALGASSVLILAISLSRVYVGEHWATDVLGGWLFGFTWLLALLRLRWGLVRGRA